MRPARGRQTERRPVAPPVASVSAPKPNRVHRRPSGATIFTLKRPGQGGADLNRSLTRAKAQCKSELTFFEGGWRGIA